MLFEKSMNRNNKTWIVVRNKIFTIINACSNFWIYSNKIIYQTHIFDICIIYTLYMYMIKNYHNWCSYPAHFNTFFRMEHPKDTASTDLSPICSMVLEKNIKMLQLTDFGLYVSEKNCTERSAFATIIHLNFLSKTQEIQN